MDACCCVGGNLFGQCGNTQDQRDSSIGLLVGQDCVDKRNEMALSLQADSAESTGKARAVKGEHELEIGPPIIASTSTD